MVAPCTEVAVAGDIVANVRPPTTIGTNGIGSEGTILCWPGAGFAGFAFGLSDVGLPDGAFPIGTLN